MHKRPEDIAIALRITWSQDSGIDSLLDRLLQYPKARNAWLTLTHCPLCQEIRPLQKHELIVHRVLQSKGYVGPTKGNDTLPGILLTFSCCRQLLAKTYKPLIDHSEQQVVFVVKVEIDSRRRVANALGHLAQREALIALLQEQFACCCQDGLTQCLFLMCLPVANRLAQAFSLCTRCAFLHNTTPLDNTVILTRKCAFVKGAKRCIIIPENVKKS